MSCILRVSNIMRSLMHSIPGGQRPIVLPECNAWSLCVPWTRCLEAAGIRRNTWKKQRESCRALLSKCACSYDSYMFMLLLHIFCGRGKAQRICSWVSEQSFTLFGIQLEVFVLYHVTSLSLRVFWMAFDSERGGRVLKLFGCCEGREAHVADLWLSREIKATATWDNLWFVCSTRRPPLWLKLLFELWLSCFPGLATIWIFNMFRLKFIAWSDFHAICL